MTATSFASLTFFLSFSTFAGINIIGLAIHGLRFTNLFYPGGAPIAILPFLI
jgi:F0F1-type ATP synthase membrane subunit a